MEQLCGYGDAVTYYNRGVVSHALVIMSTLQNVLDPTQPTGIRTEEHLTLLTLKPGMGESLMTSTQVSAAIAQPMSVILFPEVPEKEPGFAYAVKSLDAHPYDASLYPVDPRYVQVSPPHVAQFPAVRSSVPDNKVAGVVVRDTDPDGGPYVPPNGGFVPRPTDWYEKTTAGTVYENPEPPQAAVTREEGVHPELPASVPEPVVAESRAPVA